MAFFFGYDSGHVRQDVNPWKQCGHEVYNKIRKPNSGKNCPDNVTDLLVGADGKRIIFPKCNDNDGSCFERQELCKQFIRSNSRIGYEWLKKLPSCPCARDSVDTSWGDDPDNVVRKYHKGAEGGCFRSLPIDAGNTKLSAQQCCYDRKGGLITNGSGAGTPDIDAADGWPKGADLGHYLKDVRPFKYCGVNVYNQVRQPNKGINCSSNKRP